MLSEVSPTSNKESPPEEATSTIREDDIISYMEQLAEEIDQTNMTIGTAIDQSGKKAVLEAVKGEMSNMFEKHKVLHPILPTETLLQKPLLPSKGFMKAKLKNGAYKNLKYRITSGGHRQKPGTFGKTSAPTVGIPNVFAICSIAKAKRLRLETVDIPGAYLHADLPESEQVYMKLAKDLVKIMCEINPNLKQFVRQDGSMIVLVKKAIYGLKQSGSLWHDHISDILLKAGFQRSKADAAIFFKTKGEKLQTVCLHVDDILHGQNDAEMSTELHQLLEESFGTLSWECGDMDYLGFHLCQKEDLSVEADVSAMTQRILNRAKINQASKTPSCLDLFNVQDDPSIDYSANISLFRSQVAELLYLTKLRSDITMEVTHLATLVSNPGPIALKKLNRVHRYLFGTVNKPVYFGTSHIELEIFADASYASHPQTMRSHGGFLVRIGKDSGAIYSKSKEQSMVTTSSCEAELLQLTNAVKQSIQVMKLLMELNCISKSFLRVY
jgi:hypothetical protein